LILIKLATLAWLSVPNNGIVMFIPKSPACDSVHTVPTPLSEAVGLGHMNLRTVFGQGSGIVFDLAVATAHQSVSPSVSWFDLPKMSDGGESLFSWHGWWQHYRDMDNLKLTASTLMGGQWSGGGRTMTVWHLKLIVVDITQIGPKDNRRGELAAMVFQCFFKMELWGVLE
jgi:hypothetical protein